MGGGDRDEDVDQARGEARAAQVSPHQPGAEPTVAIQA